MSEFLRFESQSSESGLTQIVEVYNSHLTRLGQIRWFSPWRRYCFYPYPNSIYDAKCMGELISKIDELMSKRQ